MVEVAVMRVPSRYKNFKGPFKQYMVADKYFTMLYMAVCVCTED